MGNKKFQAQQIHQQKASQYSSESLYHINNRKPLFQLKNVDATQQYPVKGKRHVHISPPYQVNVQVFPASLNKINVLQKNEFQKNSAKAIELFRALNKSVGICQSSSQKKCI